MTNDKTLEIFKAAGGILKGHFLLTSGRHSDTYMQCAKVFCNADYSEKLCKQLAEKLKHYNADFVVSPAIGGIIFGYEVSRHLKCTNVFTERVDGSMQFRRGFEVSPESRVIVVEDVVTTGGSVREVIALCKQQGANVVAVGCLVDRSNGQVQFEAPLTALISMDVVSYEADKCPICKSGEPLVKPGSKIIK